MLHLTAALPLTLFVTLAAWLSPPWQQTGSQSRRAPVQNGITPIRVGDQQFMTGFEPLEATAIPVGEVGWMTFQNTSSFPAVTPWAMSVFYQAPGSVNDRFARITRDPVDPTNSVLHYWLRNAVIPSGFQAHTKGRIQTGFPARLDAVELYSRQRMFLHADMNAMHSYPPNGDPWWLAVIVQELWSGANWLGDPFPSRIKLSLYSDAGQMRLGVQCRSSQSSAIYWSAQNVSYEVPVGEWLSVETGYRMGDASTGRMVIVVTRESTGERTVVINVTDWTFDPNAVATGGPGPRPLTHWNPQKVYASDNMIHHIRDQGGVAQVYWDDFAYSETWPRAWP